MYKSFETTGRRTLALMCTSFVLAGSLLACQVPVFRFALERWSPDHYQILVLSEGTLTADQLASLEPLKEKHRKSPTDLKVVDVTTTKDPFIGELWKKQNHGTGPVIVSMYPESSSTPPKQAAFATTLSQPHVQQTLSSPARDQVIQRLASGHSAVWILLESGDAEKDRVAVQTLQAQIEKDAQWLTLPSPEEMEIKPAVLEEAKIKLRIEFSIVSVNREDPNEQFLVNCLLNSETDLKDFDEPIAFPVFGRGRVLYALVGAGISSDTIRAASAFIAGPCSCQVKSQNPGFDLLLCNDWDAAVGDKFISQPLPETNAKPELLTIPPGRAKR
jgi:hypothetical protein